MVDMIDVTGAAWGTTKTNEREQTSSVTTKQNRQTRMRHGQLPNYFAKQNWRPQ
jgi:hypothetical protein